MRFGTQQRTGNQATLQATRRTWRADRIRTRARASRGDPGPALARAHRPRAVARVRERSVASSIKNPTLAMSALGFIAAVVVCRADVSFGSGPAASRQPANVSRGPGSGPPAVGSRTAGSAISGHSPESGLRVRGSWLADLANRARAALGTRPDARIGFRRCMRRLRSWSNLCPNTLCDIRPSGRVAVATSCWSRTRSGKRSQNSPLR